MAEENEPVVSVDPNGTVYVDGEEQPEQEWEDEYEEEEACAEGFTADEDCNPESRRGIEYCEFLCPWHLLSHVSKEKVNRNDRPHMLKLRKRTS